MVVSMPAQSNPNLSVGQFAERYRREMIPLSKPFSYFFAALPLTEEDIKEYLEEPIAALPPLISARLPKISILLVPYLDKGNHKAGEMVCLEKPGKDRVSWSSRFLSKEEAVFVFALKDQEVADYHYRFYHLLAALVAEQWSPDVQKQYLALVREEMNSSVHGEVDDESWRLKQTLLRRQKTVRNETKLFREYAKQSFIDSLTLYLHGICCDIDVETGPRQLQSRYLRKRLQLLYALYPPPQGYVLFPEDASKKHE
jgi:hypothetical protein